MHDALVRKLRHGANLSPADEAALITACSDVRSIEAREDLVVEGDVPKNVHVVLEGFACRYKLLPNGGRQIMAWLVPGDFCDLHVAVLGHMDHSISTLAPAKIAYISTDKIDRLVKTSTELSRALWWATLVDEGVLREWLVNMGRRTAEKQVAHLLCELLVRLQAVGLAQDHRIEAPITQVELADTVGLSSVHVNRVLQQLRERELIHWEGRALTILDPERLKALAEFDPNYLHLDTAM